MDFDDDDRAFQRGVADKCRQGADELEAALDSGQPTKTVLGIWWKLVHDPMLAMLTGDISKANITPR